jgi:hypothetical protein
MKHVPIAISFRLALRIATNKTPCCWYAPFESPVGPWLPPLTSPAAGDRDRHFRNSPATFIRMPIVGIFHTSERANGKSAIYRIA